MIAFWEPFEIDLGKTGPGDLEEPMIRRRGSLVKSAGSVPKSFAIRAKTGLRRPRHVAIRGRLVLGFSLVEVLIAVTILSITGLGFILAFRQSGAKQEAFSSEHFSAMFITQKIFEDIGSRLRENPHYFNELEKENGEVRKVVDDRDGFFHLLENTDDFTYLDETQDEPISPKTAALFQQYNGFSYSVDVVPGSDPGTGDKIPGLLTVSIAVFWTEKQGAEREYRVSHQVQGFDESLFRRDTTKGFETFDEDEVSRNLWEICSPGSMPARPTFKSFIDLNRGDPGLVFDLAVLVRLSVLCENVNEKYNAEILDLTASRDAIAGSFDPKMIARSAVLQEKLAKAFEEKASFQVGFAFLALPSVLFLQGKSFDENSMGSLVSPVVDDVARYVWKTSFVAERILYDFEVARSLYASLLRPPYKDGVSQRKITTISRKVLDLYKMVALIDSGTKRSSDHMQEVKGFLDFLNQQFKGRQPHFVKFLNTEYQICTTIDTLLDFYGGKQGVGGQLCDLGNSPQVLDEIYMHIPNSGDLGVAPRTAGKPTLEPTPGTPAAEMEEQGKTIRTVGGGRKTTWSKGGSSGTGTGQTTGSP